MQCQSRKKEQIYNKCVKIPTMFVHPFYTYAIVVDNICGRNLQFLLKFNSSRSEKPLGGEIFY